MSKYEERCEELKTNPKTWLITGVAGFIGSNLLEKLLRLNQKVIGLDNFSTGYKENLDDVKNALESDGVKTWSNFRMIEGDIRSLDTCKEAISGCDYVLHQGALGSVPRSINDPIASNESNVVGTLNIFWAAKEMNVKRVVYASSSSVYGDNEDLPKVEEIVGHPLSPYAVTKKVTELYGKVFSEQYDLDLIGIRYFNVFGPRQNPNGPYAAVIPKWTLALIKNDDVQIYGDGKTSRDFTYIENVIQMNILSAVTEDLPKGIVFNGALNSTTSLTDLYGMIRDEVAKTHLSASGKQPSYTDFRAGDIRHSNANIEKATKLLGYEPTHNILEGMPLAINWYKENLL